MRFNWCYETYWDGYDDCEYYTGRYEVSMRLGRFELVFYVGDVRPSEPVKALLE